VEEGAAVAVAQRSPLDAALAEEKAVVHIPVDLSDASVLSRVVDDAAAELGGLDILVNNAGGIEPPYYPDAPVEHWSYALDLNLRAVMLATQVMVCRAGEPHRLLPVTA
jgi:3-oxoacyl-[acyl-carrier protein] reductase